AVAAVAAGAWPAAPRGRGAGWRHAPAAAAAMPTAAGAGLRRDAVRKPATAPEGAVHSGAAPRDRCAARAGADGWPAGRRRADAVRPDAGPGRSGWVPAVPPRPMAWARAGRRRNRTG